MADHHMQGRLGLHCDHTLLMHGNVFPCGRGGSIVDNAGEPYLARSTSHKPPGVQVARLVCYNTTNLDSFAETAQMAWDSCLTDSQRRALVQEIVGALNAPLDARFLGCLVGES